MHLQVWSHCPWEKIHVKYYMYTLGVSLHDADCQHSSRPGGYANGQQLEDHFHMLFIQRWSEAWLRPGRGCALGFSCAFKGLDHSLPQVADIGLASPTVQEGWSQQTPDSYHLSAESGTPETSSSKAARWTSDEERTAYPTDSRERHKERERNTKEEGIVLEVKKKYKYVEPHYDDCGENLSGIIGQADIDQYFSWAVPVYVADAGEESSDE